MGNTASSSSSEEADRIKAEAAAIAEEAKVPLIVRLPYPTTETQKEILLEATLPCDTCNLSIKSIASVATVQLGRYSGAVSAAECDQYEVDKRRVDAKVLGLFEFASRIHQGLYLSRANAAEGFCRELGMSDYNLQQIAQGTPFSDDMLIYKRARPVIGLGGFSAETKAQIELSLPIELVFSGVSSYISSSTELPLRREPFLSAPQREHFLPLIIWGGVELDRILRGKADDGQLSNARSELAKLKDELARAKAFAATLGPSDYPFSTQSSTQSVRQRTVLNRAVSVKSMSLYYPFPLRVNGKQYDAALAFNDPSNPASGDTVILIPLVVSQSGDEASAKFIRQFAKFLPAIRDVDPMTGLYPRATVATGTEWNLADLFNMAQPPEGATIPGEPDVNANERLLIRNGFYIWNSINRYDPVVKSSTPPLAGTNAIVNIEWHAWEPSRDDASTLYLMLDSPLKIDSTDFVTLTRMLPPTPAETAIHPIPINEKYIYHKAGVPPADSENAPTEGGSPCSSDMCTESYVNYNASVDFDRAQSQYESLKDVLSKNYSTTNYDDFLNNCPGAKCDVFLQNLKQVNLPDHRIVLKVIYSVLFLLAIVVGVYFALAAITRGYHSNVAAVGETFGKLAGITARNWVTGADPTPRPSTGPSTLDRMVSAFRRSKTPTPQ